MWHRRFDLLQIFFITSFFVKLNLAESGYDDEPDDGKYINAGNVVPPWKDRQYPEIPEQAPRFPNLPYPAEDSVPDHQDNYQGKRQFLTPYPTWRNPDNKLQPISPISYDEAFEANIKNKRSQVYDPNSQNKLNGQVYGPNLQNIPNSQIYSPNAQNIPNLPVYDPNIQNLHKSIYDPNTQLIQNTQVYDPNNPYAPNYFNNNNYGTVTGSYGPKMSMAGFGGQDVQASYGGQAYTPNTVYNNALRQAYPQNKYNVQAYPGQAENINLPTGFYPNKNAVGRPINNLNLKIFWNTPVNRNLTKKEFEAKVAYVEDVYAQPESANQVVYILKDGSQYSNRGISGKEISVAELKLKMINSYIPKSKYMDPEDLKPNDTNITKNVTHDFKPTDTNITKNITHDLRQDTSSTTHWNKTTTQGVQKTTHNKDVSDEYYYEDAAIASVNEDDMKNNLTKYTERKQFSNDQNTKKSNQHVKTHHTNNTSKSQSNTQKQYNNVKLVFNPNIKSQVNLQKYNKNLQSFTEINNWRQDENYTSNKSLQKANLRSQLTASTYRNKIVRLQDWPSEPTEHTNIGNESTINAPNEYQSLPNAPAPALISPNNQEQYKNQQQENQNNLISPDNQIHPNPSPGEINTNQQNNENQQWNQNQNPDLNNQGLNESFLVPNQINPGYHQNQQGPNQDTDPYNQNTEISSPQNLPNNEDHTPEPSQQQNFQGSQQNNQVPSQSHQNQGEQNNPDIHADNKTSVNQTPNQVEIFPPNYDTNQQNPQTNTNNETSIQNNSVLNQNYVQPEVPDTINPNMQQNIQNPESVPGNKNDNLVPANPHETPELNQQPTPENIIQQTTPKEQPHISGKESDISNTNAQTQASTQESPTTQQQSHPQIPQYRDLDDYVDIPGWDDVVVPTIKVVTAEDNKTAIEYPTTPKPFAVDFEVTSPEPDSVVVAAAKETMLKHNLGYFLGFVHELFEIVAAKPHEEASNLIWAAKRNFDQLIETGALNDMGEQAINGLRGIVGMVTTGAPEVVQVTLKTGQHRIINRDTLLVPEVTLILNIIDSAYNVEQGERLLKTLNGIYDPGDKTVLEVTKEMVDAIFQAYFTAPVPNRNKLFEMINDSIAKYDAMNGRRNIEDKDDTNMGDITAKENSSKKSKQRSSKRKSVNNMKIMKTNYSTYTENFTKKPKKRKTSTVKKVKKKTTILHTNKEGYNRLKLDIYNYEKTLRSLHKNHEKDVKINKLDDANLVDIKIQNKVTKKTTPTALAIHKSKSKYRRGNNFDTFNLYKDESTKEDYDDEDIYSFDEEFKNKPIIPEETRDMIEEKFTEDKNIVKKEKLNKFENDGTENNIKEILLNHRSFSKNLKDFTLKLDKITTQNYFNHETRKSEDEKLIKTKLINIFKNSNFTFNKFRRVFDGLKFKRKIEEPVSASDEEMVFKQNIYKVFGYGTDFRKLKNR